jgi:hypothetical protein
MNHYQNNFNSEIVSEYADALRRDLTFNSRPHILNLTTIAKENMKYYREITQTIVHRIRTVSVYAHVQYFLLFVCLFLNIY